MSNGFRISRGIGGNLSRILRPNVYMWGPKMGSRIRSAQERLGGTANQKTKLFPTKKRHIHTTTFPFLICILFQYWKVHHTNTHTDKNKFNAHHTIHLIKTVESQTGNYLVLLWICVRFHRFINTCVIFFFFLNLFFLFFD